MDPFYSQMGATYHVSYPVIVRSSFGMIGSYPAIVIRGQLSSLLLHEMQVLTV